MIVSHVYDLLRRPACTIPAYRSGLADEMKESGIISEYYV